MKALPLLLCASLFACNSVPSPVEKKRTRNDSGIKPEAVAAAANPYADPDVSQMDVSYFPPDYPVMKMAGKTNDPPKARVIYSRPHRGGRNIFGNLLPYGQPWRLGANEATEIEFFSAAQIEGKTVSKGRYVLYCIPYDKEWQIIFNSNTFTWGLQPDRTKDVVSFTIPVERTAVPIEFFTMVFQPAGEGANLVMAWENLEAKLPIAFR